MTAVSVESLCGNIQRLAGPPACWVPAQKHEGSTETQKRQHSGPAPEARRGAGGRRLAGGRAAAWRAPRRPVLERARQLRLRRVPQQVLQRARAGAPLLLVKRLRKVAARAALGPPGRRGRQSCEAEWRAELRGRAKGQARRSNGRSTPATGVARKRRRDTGARDHLCFSGVQRGLHGLLRKALPRKLLDHLHAATRPGKLVSALHVAHRLPVLCRSAEHGSI